MKNLIKLFGTIALVVTIGFFVTGCSDESEPQIENYIHNVVYGGGKFVATGTRINRDNDTSTAKIAYSSDGATWTAVSNTPFGSESIGAIAYGGGKFIAVGYNGSIAAYSADGVTWTAISPTPDIFNGFTGDISYGGDKFVAVDAERSIAYSTDGVTWTAVTDISSGRYYRITYGGGLFVAAGYQNTGGGRSFAYSDDGEQWTETTSTVLSGISGISFVNERFIAYGYASPSGGGSSYIRIAYSTNGESWTGSGNTNTFSAFNGGITGVFNNGSNYFIIGSYYSDHTYYGRLLKSYTNALSSSMSWSQVMDDVIRADWQINSIASSGDRYVAVGNDRSVVKMAYSDDGETWTAVTNTTFK